MDCCRRFLSKDTCAGAGVACARGQTRGRFAATGVRSMAALAEGAAAAAAAAAAAPGRCAAPEAAAEEADQELPVRVAVNVRPLIGHERADGCTTVLATRASGGGGGGEALVEVTSSGRSFAYDYVFAPGAAEASLYEECVAPLVEGLFKGYNATVLAYGQTGSGKTYTMGTAYTPGAPPQGVTPRAMADICARAEALKAHAEVTLRVSFIELHKEAIHDLLDPSGGKGAVAIREQAGGGIVLSGAQEVVVGSVEEMAATLERGSLARATASTSMNSRSSRSHAIFTVHLEARRNADAEEGAMPTEYVTAKLHLVDLAGSERAKRTKAEGKRFQEGVHINRGLLALGNVISALSAEAEDQQQQPATHPCADGPPPAAKPPAPRHIPYRDSKLTRLLQDSLGGNSRTVMVACVSPADSNLEETLNTLKYAGRARNIKNTPTVNSDSSAEEVVRLRQQLSQAQATIRSLKVKVRQQGGGGGGGAGAGGFGRAGGAGRPPTAGGSARELAALREDNARLADALLASQHELAGALAAIGGGEGTETHCGGEMSAEEVDAAGTRLAELKKSLEAKQATLLRVSADGRQVEVLKAHYERQMTSIEAERKSAERERDEMMARLDKAKGKSGEERSKLQARFKDKVKTLEEKVSQLRSKAREAAKLEALQRRSQEAVKRLQGDVESIKRQRVQLEQRLRREAKAFQRERTQQQKQITQSRRQEERSKASLAKLKNLHERQAHVLKQKMSELATMSRKVKESVDRRSGVERKPASRPTSASARGAWSTAPSAGKAAAAGKVAAGSLTLTSSELQRRVEEEVELAVQLDGARRGLGDERARLAQVTAQRDAARQALADARLAGAAEDEGPVTKLKAQEMAFDMEVVDASAAIARDEATLAAAEKALEAARGAALGAPRRRLGSDMRSSADANAALAAMADKVVASAVDVAAAKEARDMAERRAEEAERELRAAAERTAALENAASKASKRVSLCMTGTPTPAPAGTPVFCASPVLLTPAAARAAGGAAAAMVASEELVALGRDVRASVAAAGLFANGQEEALATPSVPPGTHGRRMNIFDHPSEDNGERSDEESDEGEVTDNEVSEGEADEAAVSSADDSSGDEWRATPMHRRRPAMPVSAVPDAAVRTHSARTRAAAAAATAVATTPVATGVTENRRYSGSSGESSGSASDGGDTSGSASTVDSVGPIGRIERKEVVTFLKERKGVKRLPAPVVNGKAVSLPTLADAIWQLGGPAIVEAERLWDRVAERVGVRVAGARTTASRAAAGVHRAYERHLEEFFIEWAPSEGDAQGAAQQQLGETEETDTAAAGEAKRRGRGSTGSTTSSLAARPSWVDVVMTPPTARTSSHLTPTSRREDSVVAAGALATPMQAQATTPVDMGTRPALGDASNRVVEPSPGAKVHAVFSKSLRSDDAEAPFKPTPQRTGRPDWCFR